MTNDGRGHIHATMPKSAFRIVNPTLMRIETGPRKLVLFFDGTWNRREDTTNVWRMKLLLRRSADQLAYYDEGVGTEKGEAIRGGAFGYGLSSKVLAGYLWLMENYEDATESPRGVPDEIFLFGFSRGAFTARSLAGFLDLCGLMRKDATSRIQDAFDLSKTEDLKPYDEPARRFRMYHSREIDIKLLAVWDTVGALGDPRLLGRILENAKDHKVVELPRIVRQAVHALAIDEPRALFRPTLWPGRSSSHQDMEQRWFVGAHANVGGGYEHDGLFLRPLQWIQRHAERAGLEFGVNIHQLSPVFDTSFPRDPLDEIGYGAYGITQRFKRFHRAITLGARTRESLDFTVLEKWAWGQVYKPPSICSLLGQTPRKRPRARRLSDEELLDLLPGTGWVRKFDRGFSL